MPYIPSRNFGFQKEIRLQRIVRVKPAEGFEFEEKPWWTIELTCACRAFTIDTSIVLGAFQYCARHNEPERKAA